MSLPPTLRRPGRRVAVALVVAATAALPACGGNPEQPQTGTDAPDVRGAEDLEDPYDGPYTADFHTDVEAYAEQEVTLEAAVDRVLSPIAFTITGPGGADVEPILVLSRAEVPDLEPGQEVVVAAVPQRAFELASAESELDVDLPDEAYEEWEGEPYLSAGIVEMSGAAK